MKYPMQAMITYGTSKFLSLETQKAEFPFQERKNPEEKIKAGTQNLETFASHLDKINAESFG